MIHAELTYTKMTGEGTKVQSPESLSVGFDGKQQNARPNKGSGVG